MSIVDETIALLRSREATMRCSELEAALRAVGLSVTKGASGKHRIVDHESLSSIAGNFDGGHGKDAQVKPAYVKKMRRLIELNYTEINDHLEKK